MSQNLYWTLKPNPCRKSMRFQNSTFSKSCEVAELLPDTTYQALAGLVCSAQGVTLPPLALVLSFRGLRCSSFRLVECLLGGSWVVIRGLLCCGSSTTHYYCYYYHHHNFYCYYYYYYYNCYNCYYYYYYYTTTTTTTTTTTSATTTTTTAATTTTTTASSSSPLADPSLQTSSM